MMKQHETKNRDTATSDVIPDAEFICINCCRKSGSLFLKYSDNGIRLTRCTDCGKPVDAYIEYDIVLIIIDLILQYIGAYRHLLINTKNNPYHKLCIVFLLCDAYNKWIRRRIMSGTENIYDLEWKFYECLLQSALEMISFVGIVVTMLWPFTTTAERRISLTETLRASCASFYGNIFVVLSIIWHLHVVWSYRALTELFIFISHVQTQRALQCKTMARTVVAVALATIISRLIGLFICSYCFM